MFDEEKNFKIENLNLLIYVYFQRKVLLFNLWKTNDIKIK